MIFDHLNNLSFYLPQHPQLARVVTFMRQKNYTELESGSHWLDTPELRVIKETSRGKGDFKGVLEVHREHIDIQIALTGTDRIGYRPLLSCHKPQSEFDYHKDIQFFDDLPLFWLDLPEGYFCMLFPQDAHAPLSINKEIDKLIFKLKVLN